MPPTHHLNDAYTTKALGPLLNKSTSLIISTAPYTVKIELVLDLDNY